MAMPMLSYSCENWTMNQSDKKSMNQLKFLRSAAELTLLNQKRNTDVHTISNLHNLNEYSNEPSGSI